MDNQKTLDEKSAEKKAFIEWDIENDLPSNIGPYVCLLYTSDAADE